MPRRRGGRESFREEAAVGILWTYSFAKKRKVYGVHIVVVLLWCGAHESLRIPVAFRLWRPKRSCAPHAYRTKLHLAEAMLKEVIGSGCCVPAIHRLRYTLHRRVVHQGSGEARAHLGRGTLDPRTIVLWRSRREAVAELAGRLPLKWRESTSGHAPQP